MNNASDTPRTALDEALTATPDEDAGIAAEGVGLGPWLRLSTIHHDVETVVVGAVDLLETVRRVSPATPGIPGALLHQVSLPRVDTLVLDWHAFSSGPWMGALDTGAATLHRELLEAASHVQSNGGRVLALTYGLPQSSAETALYDACTANLAESREPGHADDTGHTPVWSAVRSVALARGRSHTPHETEVR
ncbi:hypothetical protein [Micrococcus luteus]|uniref:hypothetical protein n=1 Tax=Micrococcus luteus TaxID=1270 RepID=UPI001E425783|nr:hypothetical protein [Micrococcus luteus]MCD0174154.1 hypothetical protein [Micrococcus luteus]MCD0182909.1 hypothetical protein [Micrococcus luteus]MCV7647480.1 hypothetical protein [Micrococcus luteus]